jgi:plasmid stabilization system protein ParE
MSARVVLTPTAVRQAEAAHAWWLANRPDARTQLLDELQESLGLLATHPKLGRFVPPPLPRGVRYWLLRRTRHHVFYRQEGRGHVVRILAVWSAERGEPPALT